MLAFISLFLPPFLLVYIWDKYIDHLSSGKAYALSYIFSVICLNGINIAVLSFIFKNNDDLIYKLNHSNSMVVKYIALAAFLAVSLPFVAAFLRKYVCVKVRPYTKTWTFPWRVLAILYAFVLFILNFIRIFDNNFWGDEGFTIYLAQMNLSSMIDVTAHDVHPPLYYVLVKVICTLFGFNGAIFHFVSLIPYMITLILALTFIWNRFGRETAFILLTLSSLLSTAVQYNVEVRMYSWGGLFVLLSYLFMREIMSQNKIRNYAGFVIFSLAAAYTHYFCLVSVAFFYLVLIIVALVKRKEYLLKTALSCILTILGYLPWFFTLLKAFKRTANGFWMTEIPTFKSCIAYIFSGRYAAVFFGVMLVSLVIFAIYELRVIRIYKTEKGVYVFSVGLSELEFSWDVVWAASGILSIVGTIIVGRVVSMVIRPMFMTRYIYPVAVVGWLLLGFGISKCKGRMVYVIVIMAMLLYSCVPQYRTTYIYDKDSNNILEATLEATVDAITPGGIILTDNSHIAWTIADYYYPGTESVLISFDSLPILEQSQNYWLILSGEMNETTSSNLTEQGYTYEEVVRQGILGCNTVFIYRLITE